MDIVFDPPGSGMFSEVYLYEELMEADLHAIVSKTNPTKWFIADPDGRSGPVSRCRTHTFSRSSTRRCAV